VPPLSTAVAATAAGIGIVVGLGAFFQAIVVGNMSVVAPVAATGAFVPVVAALVGGERPSLSQALGILAAVGGVSLASRTSGDPRAGQRESGIGLALLAAGGFGSFLWLMAPASRHGVPWAILIARGVPAVILSAVVASRRPSFREARESRTAIAIVAAGVLVVLASTLYAYATRHGELAIVSVLAAVSPVVTVLLAYRVLNERVYGARQVGIIMVLAAVVVLSI
jgi:drug/metabolite transporter (DMT)-like permease